MTGPSEKKRRAMEALTKEELIEEINLGRKSRFSMNIPFLQTRLDLINAEEQRCERKENLSLGKTQNRQSKIGLWIAGIAVLVTVVLWIVNK